MTFHDDKLWQGAFTALLDILENVVGNDDVSQEVRRQAMQILTTIASSISTKEHIDPGLIVSLRSLLSVLWAKDVLTDDNFAKLDGAYEALANKLPR